MNSFKLDDWVRVMEEHAKNKIFKVTGLLGTDVLLGNCFNYKADHCELWQPKVGEWCWFWNKCMDIDQSPRLAQFHLIVEELQKPMDFPAFYQIKYKATKLGYLYDFCEPFIGQLPTHLKDQS